MPALGTQAVTLGTGLKWLTAWIQPATVKNLQQVVFRPAEYSQLFKNINNDRRYANKMHYYCETKRSAQIRGSLVQCLRWAFVRRPPNTQTLTPPPLSSVHDRVVSMLPDTLRIWKPAPPTANRGRAKPW